MIGSITELEDPSWPPAMGQQELLKQSGVVQGSAAL